LRLPMLESMAASNRIIFWHRKDMLGSVAKTSNTTPRKLFGLRT
jgi:hypothetical protein